MAEKCERGTHEMAEKKGNPFTKKGKGAGRKTSRPTLAQRRMSGMSR